MNDTSSDDILLLKQRLAEQEVLIRALKEKLSSWKREIDHLQAQLDKLHRMNFGSATPTASDPHPQTFPQITPPAMKNVCGQSAPAARSGVVR